MDTLFYTVWYMITRLTICVLFYYVIINGTVLATTLFLTMMLVMSYLRAHEKTKKDINED